MCSVDVSLFCMRYYWYFVILFFINTSLFFFISIWQEIISEGLGIVIQIINIIIAVWLPVLIIHLKASAFSISEF